ncbi:Meiotically up-regulated gene 89 protein [Zancudomyces culisetae]|uniref:Meiotically up-regulated gene 89 protein n=1 Tax=Zancudomyces culisetae TaxID=1213189 RepID=A0A1R1PKK9_ZANCU|nr:Meiotically up-regulated gene 89 protein [Zancudomyces culisetae]|eukprot:OMH81495.1 Meiotically up-regulated gene 89 protein [Zancudomyces culisetae]
MFRYRISTAKTPGLATVAFLKDWGYFYYMSGKIFELDIDYTSCLSATDNFVSIPNSQYSANLGYGSGTFSAPLLRRSDKKECTYQFTIPKTVNPPVFLYYKLTSFYQNHRRYVKSFDSNQLSGKARSVSDLSGGDCEPLAVREIKGVTKPIYPCGLIANSQFNDTFSNLVRAESGGEYVFGEDDISWASDRARYGKTEYSNSDVYPPPNWDERYKDGYTDKNPIPDLSTDYHLQVWMRTAALPVFRKLYGINNSDPLTPTTYSMKIGYNFDTTTYGGEKHFIISTTSAFGGRNPIIGIFYMAVGCLSILIGIVLVTRQLYKPRSLGDLSSLTWNR